MSFSISGFKIYSLDYNKITQVMNLYTSKIKEQEFKNLNNFIKKALLNYILYEKIYTDDRTFHNEFLAYEIMDDNDKCKELLDINNYKNYNNFISNIIKIYMIDKYYEDHLFFSTELNATFVNSKYHNLVNSIDFDDVFVQDYWCSTSSGESALSENIQTPDDFSCEVEKDSFYDLYHKISSKVSTEWESITGSYYVNETSFVHSYENIFDEFKFQDYLTVKDLIESIDKKELPILIRTYLIDKINKENAPSEEKIKEYKEKNSLHSLYSQIYLKSNIEFNREFKSNFSEDKHQYCLNIFKDVINQNIKDFFV